MRIAILSPSGRFMQHHKSCNSRKNAISLLSEGLIKRGVDVTLFTSSDLETKERLEPNCSIPCKEENHLNFIACVSSHMVNVLKKAGEFDLIHNYFNLVPLFYRCLINTPMVTTIHAPSSDILSLFKEDEGRSYYVSTSIASRNPCLEYISTIYDSIDLQSFTLKEQKENYLISFGNIHPNNGIEEAIEIARKSGMKLILTGNVLDQTYFENVVLPQQGDHLIIHCGMIDQVLKDKLLGGAYAFLHSIRFGDPFDLSIIEAMACGTPVIAFSGSAMHEIIKDCETGYIVESIEDALNRLKHISTINRMQCRRWVEDRFSQDRMVDDYLKVYKKILEMERPRAHHANPPWGKWEVLLDEPTYKVKRITVLPGNRLSYQKHFQREEYWNVVGGKASVTIDGKEILLKSGQAIDIPKGAAHRVANQEQSSLVFIEIQRGNYLGEDDIVRLEDDYGRS
ncbi:MAG: glycosyltransferase [Candidatus Jettenia sp.]|uniref:Mannose-6-phosphate isomerase n=1 Tax=Candidatus Jettenia caeni TaxID=247490 RepID=I3IQW8_9BACT|nr:glycosyltransferase [Candidatus Jettenia sp. AMX1]MBC6928173.1 glycosyltransferase [Candidatus Jettenia sp.]WKZ15469.1 MAG: glycosyltransferase [Candidatus Jettenia caeni]KAA0249020.1 MAG: glycosyltransferase [Candidatus Jettenia sp. AMX1]MCE7879562.1 glycosyltransferase [Candidatus Jettenia sp. AMX1]MCQ3926921.1 glycosyltransferase [Candidatus Jettenia sp.]